MTAINLICDYTIMKKLIFLIFFVFFSLLTHCQISIEGYVTDSLGVVKNANVLNLSSNTGTNTNEEGNFFMPVRLGDTLQISSIQHHTKNVIIANITLKERKITIDLQLKVYVLDEFELKQHDLSGFLTIDLNSVPEDNTPKFDAVSLGLPYAGTRKLTQIERKIYTATTGNGIIPIDLVINVLSGRLKRLKEQARLIKENNEVEYMYKNYRFFIQDYYGITQSDIYRFLYFCISDPSYHKGILKNEMAMIAFLKNSAVHFKKISNESESKNLLLQ